ncbi:hypothetical protein Droror1_Dr00003516 [Drosera rotundifolia]
MVLEIGAAASENFEWDTDDELEIEYRLDSELGPTGSNKVSPSPSFSSCGKVDEFVRMGFSRSIVLKAIEENGEENTQAILDALLTYTALENSSPKKHSASDSHPQNDGGLYFDDLFDDDSSSSEQGTRQHFSENDRTLSLLVEMGYDVDVALNAVKKCGCDAPVEVLADFISAAELVEHAAPAFSREASSISKPMDCHDERTWTGTSTGCARQPVNGKRKKYWTNEMLKAKLLRRDQDSCFNRDDNSLHLPNPMIGYGVPGRGSSVTERKIPEEAIGPPYFYYENVALTPKGVWNTISKFLYDIEPEFVDSLFFSAAARKRGYIHNLPLDGRFPLLPIPPQTIHEAFPSTKAWWPSWDSRSKLNCLLTCVASAKLTEKIRTVVEKWNGEAPPLLVQKQVSQLLKKWNLVWVGQNKVAPLEPDEMEMLLGFPQNHTRGGGVSRCERYKVLGNSFQVDTVAYHLSVLKSIFPQGMNVLSLFSGIGGAEVALHRLGIPLCNVVAVEKSEVSRSILRGWWDQTKQKGNLIVVADVQEVTPSMVEMWISAFGGFDLVIGGSPCNNLAGGNRHHRHGLEGEHSSLFFELYRILNLVRGMMRQS